MRRSAGEPSATYKAFPPGSNEISDAKSFRSIQELALFLLSNPDWKVWLKGIGKLRDGQLTGGLVIEGEFDLDELRAKRLI